jgi:hypothetical protein
LSSVSSSGVSRSILAGKVERPNFALDPCNVDISKAMDVLLYYCNFSIISRTRECSTVFFCENITFSIFFCGAKFSWNKSRWLRDNKSRNNQKLLKFIGLRECHHLIFFVQWLYTTYIGSSLFTDVKQAKMSKKYGKASHLSVRGKFCGCV